MQSKVILAATGIEYPLAWGNLARFQRRSSIPAGEWFPCGHGLTIQLAWCAYGKAGKHPFPRWEDLQARLADLDEDSLNELLVEVVAVLPEPAPANDANKSTEPAPPEQTEAEKKRLSLSSAPLPATSSG